MLLATTNGVFAETDFSGKTIKWVVPFSEGGGADAIARFFAPLLSEELPGQIESTDRIQRASASATKRAGGAP